MLHPGQRVVQQRLQRLRVERGDVGGETVDERLSIGGNSERTRPDHAGVEIPVEQPALEIRFMDGNESIHRNFDGEVAAHVFVQGETLRVIEDECDRKFGFRGVAAFAEEGGNEVGRRHNTGMSVEIFPTIVDARYGRKVTRPGEFSRSPLVAMGRRRDGSTTMYNVSLKPVQGTQGGANVLGTDSQTSKPDDLSQKASPSHPLDRLTMTKLGVAASSDARINAQEVVSKIPLGFVARVKEFLGIGSATANVRVAAANLVKTLEHAQRDLQLVSTQIGLTKDNLSGSAENVVENTSKYAAALQTWVDRHGKDGTPSGTDRATLQTMNKALTDTKALLKDLTEGKDLAKLQSKLLSKAPPPGFPILEVPAFTETMLTETGKQAVASAVKPDSFLRGSESTLYNKVVSKQVTEHFQSEIEEAKTLSSEHAKTEFAENGPQLIDEESGQVMNASSLGQNDKVRDAAVRDLQTLLKAILGNDVSSARAAARKLPPEFVKITAHVAKEMTIAVGKDLTQQQADMGVRALAVNNVFLRGLATVFSESSGASGPEKTYQVNRGFLISKFMQNLANEIPFGKKEEYLKPLNDQLAHEQKLVSAFLDELQTMVTSG